MINRRHAILSSVQAGSPRKRAKRNGPWLFTFLTLGAGTVAGLAALVATTLLVGLQTLASDFAPTANTAPAIEARTLFPPVPAVHKVVNVYDPPAAAPAPRWSNPARTSASGGGSGESEGSGGDD